MRSDRHLTRYVKLTDRFGDHGLIALVIAAIEGDALEIDTFLMSCRVIGRTVETQMLAHLSREALRLDCHSLRGAHIPTAKNSIVSDFYERHGFRQLDREDSGTTTWVYDLRSEGPITNEFILEVTP
jgi:FkbH-like protein